MNKRKVVVIGSGGHAKVVIDVLQYDDSIELVGCIDANPLDKRTCLHLPILGDDRLLPEMIQQGISHAFVAIGSNAARRQIAEKLLGYGFRFVNAISKHAYMAATVLLGTGILVNHGAVVNADTILHDHVIINTGASVDHDCCIEAYSHIAPGCHIAGHVSIGEGTFLGVGTTVIDKQRVGSWSAIGAGGVVTKPLPDHVLAVGAPAKVIKSLHGIK